MAALEKMVIKDNTLMPGEWYGGQLHLAPPTDKGGAQKSYTIIINCRRRPARNRRRARTHRNMMETDGQKRLSSATE